MRDTLGDAARVVNTATVKQGGVLGFFSRDCVEVTVVVPVKGANRTRTAVERRYDSAGREEAAPVQTSDAKLLMMEQLLREAQQRMGNANDAAPVGNRTACTSEPPTRSAPRLASSGAKSGAQFSAIVDDAPPREMIAGGPAPVLPFPKRKPEPDADHTAMKEELREMREMLQVLYAEHPEAGLPLETAPSYRQLVDRGMSRKGAAALITAALKGSDPELLRDPRIFRERLYFQLRKSVPTTGGVLLPMGERRVVAFCGATGVGKTTNLAKLAAQFSLRGHARVALLTMDTYRVAAPEQLRVYANIMGIPMRVCNDEEEVSQAIKAFHDYDLVLIDTAGGSQFNLEQIHELKGMLRAAAPHEVLLVMAANTTLEDLRNVYANFGCLGPTAALFTKLDETRQYGVMLNLLVEAQLPLSYVSVGQNVPDDIRAATPAIIASLAMEGKMNCD